MIVSSTGKSMPVPGLAAATCFITDTGLCFCLGTELLVSFFDVTAPPTGGLGAEGGDFLGAASFGGAAAFSLGGCDLAGATAALTAGAEGALVDVAKSCTLWSLS